MPADRTSQGSNGDDAIRAVVVRLSRPDSSGGTVIERAAILAEGANSAAIVKWHQVPGAEHVLGFRLCSDDDCSEALSHAVAVATVIHEPGVNLT